MALALFDLDNTLLAGDSDHAWCNFLIDLGVLDGEIFRVENERFYREYKAGTLDIFEFLAFQLKPLSEHPMEKLLAWRERFLRERIEPMATEASLALVQRHREAGDTLAVVTATNSFVTEPIVKDIFGIPALLATELEQLNGHYTGHPAGIPTFREGKVERLMEWLAETGHALKGSYFYSDSQNDIPLLEKVDNPVAVDPDLPLLSHAEQRGWPVLWLNRKSEERS